MGYAALAGTTGNDNTGVGKWGGDLHSTGSASTYVGYDANPTVGSFSNATALGAGSRVNASNKIRLGNTAVSVVEGAPYITSDARFKTDVQADAPGLGFIKNLRPVTYHFDYPAFSSFLGERSVDRSVLQQKAAKREMGFLAQEVETACKSSNAPVANLLHSPDNDRDNYSLAYGQLTVPLVKAVQELSTALDEKNAEIAALKADMAALKTSLNELDVLRAELEKVKSAVSALAEKR